MCRERVWKLVLFLAIFCVAFTSLMPISQAALTLNFSSLTPSGGTTISDSNVSIVFNITNTTALAADDRLYTLCDLNRSLIAWWRMDEHNTTTIIDQSGRGNDLFLKGSANFSSSSAYGNTSLVFSNISTDYAQQTTTRIPSELTANGFTFSLWINITKKPAALAKIFGYEFSNNGFAYAIGNSTASDNSLTGERFYLEIGNGTGYTRVTSFPIPLLEGTWYHIAVKYYHDSAFFYLNGVPLSSGTYYPSMNVSIAGLNQVHVGVVNGDAFGSLNGSIDDFSIFNRALTDSEIAYLYTTSGVGTRNVSFPYYEGPIGNITAICYGVLREGTVGNSSQIDFNATRSGPYYLNYNYTFENLSTRGAQATLSAFVTHGFSQRALFNTTLLNATAYYRIDNGSWTLISSNTYVSYNASAYSGLFGDSIVGSGTTYTWPLAFDPLAATFFYKSTTLMRGVGGASCSQVRTHLLGNVTNGTTLFFGCGTNDVGNLVKDSDIFANYTGIFSDLRSRNVSIYLVDISPRIDGSTCTNITNVNTWLYSYYLNNNSDGFIKGFTDVYNSTLKNSNNCTLNTTYFKDNVHPGTNGTLVYAQLVFNQSYHFLYNDGFYANFSPTQGGTYDLRWNISTPTGQSTDQQTIGAFFISSNATTSSESSSSGGGDGGSSGSGSTVTSISESDALEGFTHSIGYKQRIAIVYKGISYYLGLQQLTQTSIVLSWSLPPQEVTLDVGQAAMFDVGTESGTHLRVHLDSISGAPSLKALISAQIQALSPVAGKATEPSNTPSDEAAALSPSSPESHIPLAVWFALISLIALALLIIVVVRRSRQPLGTPSFTSSVPPSASPKGSYRRLDSDELYRGWNS